MERDMAALMDKQFNATTLAMPLLSVGLMIVYCAAAEILFATTVGKRVMKLSVYSVQGVRPNVGQVLLRNLIKGLEVPMWPLLLMAVMLPSRQRMGDLLARTIVVMPRRQPLPPWARLSSQEPTDEDNPPGSPS